MITIFFSLFRTCFLLHIHYVILRFPLHQKTIRQFRYFLRMMYELPLKKEVFWAARNVSLTTSYSSWSLIMN